MDQAIADPTATTPDTVDATIRRWVAEYSGADVPLAALLCDRHAAADPERVAMLHEDAAGRESRLTFGELRERSRRFAGVLRDLGVAKGDRVATMLPRGPELLIATLASWRLGAVVVPLFTAFGPQAIAVRLSRSRTAVVLTDPTNRPKVVAALDLPEAAGITSRIVTAESPDGAPLAPGDLPFWAMLWAREPLTEATPLAGDDPLFVMYTSGTTGQPKGVVGPVCILSAIEQHMRFGLDVRADDIFWCMPDPGWAFGLYCALIGPMLLGMPSMLFNVPFSVESTYRLLAKYGVTNLAAAPTVYRAMRAAGEVARGQLPLRLRALMSGGEPLNPEVIAWAQATLGRPIHDHYGQTELGIMVYNGHAPIVRRPLRPPSMGTPAPGFRVVILDDAGRELPPGTIGQIAIDTHQTPCFWFRGYFEDHERTVERFTPDGRYYLTGDAGHRDADGYFFFSARADDVITSAAYRIGPFEVESALMGHPAVAEAAVVGKPDPLRGAIVKAFVVLRSGYQDTEALAEELSQFVKRQLAAHAYPREIDFLDQLPKTPSGKVQRFLLRG